MAKFTTSDGITFRYDRYGSGDPMLFLHGELLDRAFWQPQLEDLVPHTHMILPDFRWNTDAPLAYPIERLAQDMLELLDAIEMPTVSICGHGIGGTVAMYLARHYPERVNRLVLFEAAEQSPFGWMVGLLKGFIYLLPSGVLARQLGSLTHEDNLKAYIVEHARLQGKQKYLALLTAQGQYRFEGNVSQITQPTLLIRGDTDSLYSVPSEHLKHALPNADYAVIPDAGHMANWDNTPAFNQAILSYIV